MASIRRLLESVRLEICRHNLCTVIYHVGILTFGGRWHSAGVSANGVPVCTSDAALEAKLAKSMVGRESARGTNPVRSESAVGIGETVPEADKITSSVSVGGTSASHAGASTMTASDGIPDSVAAEPSVCNSGGGKIRCAVVRWHKSQKWESGGTVVGPFGLRLTKRWENANRSRNNFPLHTTF